MNIEVAKANGAEQSMKEIGNSKSEKATIVSDTKAIYNSIGQVVCCVICKNCKSRQ